MQPSSINTRILNDLQNAYMEVIPVPNIEKKLEGLSRSTHLAVTCSPTKGVDETIELSSHLVDICLLYTSPSPRDKRQSRMPSSA